VVKANGSLLFFAQHLFHAWDFLEEASHGRNIPGIIDVNMGNLVIRYGEGAALPGIKVFPAKVRLQAEITGRPQYPVRVDGPLHRGDPVFGQNDNPASSITKEMDQPPAEIIDFGKVPANITIRAYLLEDIIEMGQVDEVRVGRYISSIAMAAFPIHSLEEIDVAGPQKWKRGNWPNCLLNRSRSSGGAE
jgi:hypothetical protein